MDTFVQVVAVIGLVLPAISVLYHSVPRTNIIINLYNNKQLVIIYILGLSNYYNAISYCSPTVPSQLA